MSKCPQCESTVSIPADTQIGELISCADCGAELEVLGTEPVELILAPEVEEDWGE